MIGVGLASAVLIDATVVRGVLVPAALAVLGERTWYLPRWLRWLPGGRSLRHESEPAGAGGHPAEPAARVPRREHSRDRTRARPAPSPAWATAASGSRSPSG
jgi:hypothetical protein